MNGTHYIEPSGKKIYKALLSQSGTDAPTAIVLENTLGVNPTFTYSDVGEYILNTITAFPIGKIMIVFGHSPKIIIVDMATYEGNNELFFYTRDLVTHAFVNNGMYYTSLIIEVYP